MAVYKLFREKDATLYSEYPVMNTGIDQILEANAYQNVAGAYHASRYLVKFATANILETIQTLASGSALDTYLDKPVSNKPVSDRSVPDQIRVSRRRFRTAELFDEHLLPTCEPLR